VENAPVSDTVFTHIPLKAKTLQEIDSKREEITSVSNEENANGNAKAEHSPTCVAEVGWLSAVAISENVIRLIIFGTIVALTGPLAQSGENFLSLAQNPLTQVGENMLHQMQKRSEKLWRSIVIPLRFSLTILWDTLSFFTEPLSPENKISSVPRSVRQKSD
jgi:hypothetical protein